MLLSLALLLTGFFHCGNPCSVSWIHIENPRVTRRGSGHQGSLVGSISDSEARKQLTFRAQNSDYRRLSLDPTA